MDTEQIEIFDLIQKYTTVKDKNEKNLLQGTVAGDLINLVKTFLTEFWETSQ